jgi:hypothetical protein
VCTLEVQPLLCQVCLLAAGREAHLALRVVLLDQVLNNGTRLPEREVLIGVLDRRHAAVGVQLDEVGALDFGELHVLEVVGEAHLLGEHADLGRVGAMLAPDDDWLQRRGRHGVCVCVCVALEWMFCGRRWVIGQLNTKCVVPSCPSLDSTLPLPTVARSLRNCCLSVAVSKHRALPHHEQCMRNESGHYCQQPANNGPRDAPPPRNKSSVGRDAHANLSASRQTGKLGVYRSICAGLQMRARESWSAMPSDIT